MLRGWLLFLACLPMAMAPLKATADPTDPVVVSLPNDADGAIFDPLALGAPLLPEGYTTDEYFISGAANLYTYANPPVRGEKLLLQPDVPYTTRILVARPIDPAAFNGTVVVEWWNSTAGFDTSPVWHPSWEYFGRKGVVYVGVTNSTTSIGHLVGGCLLLGILPPPTCGTRYASLSLPENGVAFEMVSQIAHLLKTQAAPNPLHPDYPVELLFHAGQSQQGGSMVTYASAFHFPDNDGYFVQAAGTARPINFGTPCDDPDADPYPDCTPRLQGDQRLVRDDLPVPVYRVLTETDMERTLEGDRRQSDSGDFRYYETAGTAHVTVHEGLEIIPPGVLGPEGLSLDEACESPLNTLADGPIFGKVLYNAMWENMERHARFGTPPPSGDLLLSSGDELLRDADGNALGGIRVPQMDVPVASYAPRNTLNPDLPGFLAPLGNLFCRLAGAVTPFSQATLDSLYPDEGVLVSQLAERADALHLQRFLLAEEAAVVVPPTRLSGRSLTLTDQESRPSRRSLRLASTDDAVWVPARGGLGDPTLWGGTLRVANPLTGESSELALPLGGWKGLGDPAGSRGWKYRGSGGCSNVTLREGRLKAVCRGDELFSLDEPSQGSIAVSLQMGNHSPYCLEFGGDVRRDDSNAVRNGRGIFTARNAAAPGACAGP